MPLLLDGKIALVTGGSRGLGRALCEVLAREGADVAFNYSSDDEGARHTAAAIAAHGRRAHAARVSVLDGKGLQDMVAAVERELGPIAVLVNNAGASQVMPFPLLEEEDWDHILDLNVKGTYLATRAVLRGMIRRRQGRIVNIGSLAGVRMIEAPVHYCTSKAAIRGFTESLAKEMGRYGVLVNCVAPGLLEEGVGDNLPDGKRAEYLKHCALKRPGRLAEVAELVAWVASDRNSYMNGATILLDGGV
jgi:NAD(P)-dependent dehydrogenase (short-subunit alcohol dehydrogenase family)